MTSTISLAEPFDAQFRCTDERGRETWADCTVFGIQCNDSHQPDLVCLTVGGNGLISAITLAEVRKGEPYYPRRPSA